MLSSRLTRSLSTAGSIATLVLLAACTESNQTPLMPNAKPVQIQVLVTAGWDFAALIGTAAGCQDWGASKNIPKAGFGSIQATSVGGTITSKGLELPVGDTERGLGLAIGAPCAGDEVGDGGSAVLLLNFNGVLPAGSRLKQIDLGSVQTAEGWKVSISTDGGATFPTVLQGEGNGANNPGDNVSLNVDYATANLVVKFEKNTSASGNLSTDNDYVVKAVTTQFEETPSGCTFTQGYWKNHAGYKHQANAWPVASLTIGGIVYTKAEVVAIMQAPTAGNGILSLFQQLAAAKLNILSGASDVGIAQAIIDADNMIDNAGGKILIGPPSSPTLDPSVTSALTEALNSYNTGITGPGHCPE